MPGKVNITRPIHAKFDFENFRGNDTQARQGFACDYPEISSGAHVQKPAYENRSLFSARDALNNFGMLAWPGNG